MNEWIAHHYCNHWCNVEQNLVLNAGISHCQRESGLSSDGWEIEVVGFKRELVCSQPALRGHTKDLDILSDDCEQLRVREDLVLEDATGSCI